MRAQLGIAAVAASWLALAGWSCVGSIGDGAPGGGVIDGPDTEALCAAGDLPGPHPRFVRLTHAQYDNTVSALFGTTLTPSESFIADPAFSGFTNNAEKLTVSDRLARDYRRAAEALAVDLTAGQLEGVLPCTIASGDEACARDFIVDFGRRVYRRTLTEAEIASFVAAYGRADGMFETGSAFEQGIRHVIEALLQSPYFLYRIELSEELDSDKLIPLTNHEIATRLAYLLWNSTPDDELLDAADAGELTSDEGLETHARRMLADARAVGPIDDFHAQWLHVSRYENLSKDADDFPGFDGVSMAASMNEETRRFIRHVVLELDGDFQDLMTSRTTFVNDELAAIYGLGQSFGSDFVEVELDATRAGLLTHAGFLASHAYPDQPSPIHRGVFLQRQVLCTEIPDPPGDVDTNLPPADPANNTNRKRVAAFTSGDACKGCHTLVNEPGYSFENFDAVGSWRDEDGGEAVDASGSIQLDGAPFEFDGAVELIEAVAASEAANRCYLTQWYRYGFARGESEADRCTLDALEEQLQTGSFSIQDMLVVFTKTKTFRYRVAEEGAQ